MAQWTKTPLRHLLYRRQSTKSGLSTKGNAAFANGKMLIHNNLNLISA